MLKHQLTSTLLNQRDCLYETNKKFTEKSFSSFKASLLQIEGVDKIEKVSEYAVSIIIGTMFNPLVVQNKLRTFLGLPTKHTTDA